MLEELRKLEAAATPGPWSPTDDGSQNFWDVVAPDDHHYRLSMSVTDEDAHFIAAMRNALPALLDVVEAAVRVVDGAEDPASWGVVEGAQLDLALAILETALQSAQGAEKQQVPLAQQRPETGAGA